MFKKKFIQYIETDSDTKYKIEGIYKSFFDIDIEIKKIINLSNNNEKSDEIEQSIEFIQSNDTNNERYFNVTLEFKLIASYDNILTENSSEEYEDKINFSLVQKKYPSLIQFEEYIIENFESFNVLNKDKNKKVIKLIPYIIEINKEDYMSFLSLNKN